MLLQLIEFDQNLQGARFYFIFLLTSSVTYPVRLVFLTQYLIWMRSQFPGNGGGERRKGCIQEVKWSLTGPSIMHSTTERWAAFLHMGQHMFVCFSLCMCQFAAGGLYSVQRGLGLYRMLSGQWWGSSSMSSSLTADILQSAADWTGRRKQDTSPSMLMRHEP